MNGDLAMGSGNYPHICQKPRFHIRSTRRDIQVAIITAPDHIAPNDPRRIACREAVVRHAPFDQTMCPDDAPIADDAAVEDRRHAADPHMIADDNLPLPTDLLCGIEVLPRTHIENRMPVIRQERHAPGNGTSFADIERSPRADGKDIARHPDSPRRRRRPFTDVDRSLRSDLDIPPPGCICHLR